ncbi:MAG: hypothetical protein FJ100_13815 [Deltaproteobacteria bacterium]|nr:hypothetical protein [Deltaproteobacteria bacterium]
MVAPAGRSLLLVLALAGGLSGAGHIASSPCARADDGLVRYQTLTTADGDIHYPAQYEAFARRAAATLRDARATVGPIFNDRPRPRLQLTIDDFGDDANGYAQTLPYDHVHLQAYPPDPRSDLGDHGDWLRMLVFHEFAHILHLGDAGGFPGVINAVFGRTLLPNAAMPRVLTEGIATWLETRHTGGDGAVAGHGGRVGSPQFGALLRAAVRDDTLPASLDRLTATPLLWPRGNGWYLYGSLLVDDAVRRHGEAPLRRFLAGFGRQIVPYGLQGHARRAWGRSLHALWTDARKAAIAETRTLWRAQAAGLGLAADATVGALETAGDGHRLSHGGNWRGRMRALPDGLGAVVAEAPIDDVRWIDRVSPEGPPSRVLRCALDCDEPMVDPSGEWLLFTETRPTQRQYGFRELIAVPWSGGPQRVVTQAARLRTPSLWLDAPTGVGRDAVLAVAVRQGRTGLAVVDWRAALRSGTAAPLRWLTELAPIGTVLDTPIARGERLWWTASAGEGRRLWRGRLAHGPRGWAVVDAAPWDPPGVPAWMAELQWTSAGQMAALASRDGKRDAGVLDPTSGTWTWRTDTVTGLTSLAALPTAVLTVRHHGRGLEIWRAPQALPQRPNPATQAVVTSAYDPTPVHAEATAYSPLPTLRPRSWRPTLVGSAPQGAWLGLLLTGRDAVHWLDASLYSQIRTDGNEPFVQLDLGLQRYEPAWSLSAAFDHSAVWYRRGWQWRAAPTGRVGARLGGSWVWPGLREAWTVSGGVRFRQVWLRETPFDLGAPHDPAGPLPIAPVVGLDLLTDLAVGWRYAERYPESVRTERIAAVSASVTTGVQAATAERRLVLGAATEQAWPLGGRNVASVNAHLAWAPWPGQRDPLYAIGGVHPLQALAVLGLGGPANGSVRGANWEGTGLGGNLLAWGTAAWTFPVADVGRSLDTLPLWLGRVSASAFADGAWAAWPAGKLRAGGLASLGVDLAAELTFGYVVDATLHLGAAVTSAGEAGSWVSLGL